MKFIEDFNVKGKRVLVRCDFNVPLNKKSLVLDDFRIEKTIPTIERLIKKGAKVILMSHLGRPQGKFSKHLSLASVQEKLLEYLDVSVTKARDCIGAGIEKWINRMREGEVLLLENLRFHKEEEENDLEFARALAELGDIYLNDAFAVSHRAHASLVGIPKFLPSGIGLLFRQEIEALSKVLKKPKRPLVGIIGGAKVHTKIDPINEFLEKVDFLLVGGKVADEILRAKGVSVGKPLPDPEVMTEIEKIELTNSKLRLPMDVVVSLSDVYTRVMGPGAARKDESVFDIGPETIRLFSQIIADAGTIFWSGPLGKIEEKQFSMGTLGVARAISKTKSYSVVGGRETVSFLRKCNLGDKFSHVSTGGGAMLQYLSKGTLAALEVL
jgi:phosphoglycerate kinase